MRQNYSAALKLIASLLILSIAQVYILASPKRILFGRLTTSYDNLVTLNGNGVISGTTILSGAQLQTPGGVTATVQLDSLGRVDLSPDTGLTLTFSEGNIAVEVSAGEAVLTTKKGINGSIRTPDGKVERTDPAKDYSSVGSAAPQGGGSGAGSGPSFGKIFLIGLPIITGSVLAGFYLPCRRGRNPSPGVPRRRNQCH